MKKDKREDCIYFLPFHTKGVPSGTWCGCGEREEESCGNTPCPFFIRKEGKDESTN